MSTRLLVTGGAGYIGAQLVIDLLLAGYDVVVVDDFSTGHPEALVRAQRLAGRTCEVHRGDVADAQLMARALVGVHAVIHLAAFKMVGESMVEPERYFRNNLGGMAALLASMQAAGVTRIVYSSSAAVYGTQPNPLEPIDEDAPPRPESPYGLSKAQGEQLLDWMVRCRQWSAVSLRYFNPVGAHPSGQIGQPPEGAASLLPRALHAILDPETPGSRLSILGTDYPTPDGTGLRDYIHVCDLSRAHLAALDSLLAAGGAGLAHQVFNVGTGRPHSVREVIAACQRATGKVVPHDEAPRRPGDVACALAAPQRLQRVLGFEARLGLDEMVASAWQWAVKNPDGYGPLEPQRAAPAPALAPTTQAV